MDEFEDRLDKALSEYLKDRSAPNSDLDPHLPVLRKLDALRDIPERDESVQSSNRQAFLEFAKSMPAPVSKSPKQRLKGWKTIFGRERRLMTTIVSIVLALIVAFGGVGTTAYAAQDSLPTELLYPVKEFTEQLRLALTTDTEAEVQLLLELTQERVREMVSLASMGVEVPEKIQTHFQEQLKLALATAAQLGDPELMGALEGIQTMAQNQIQAMNQVQENVPSDPPCEALQLAIQAMNQARNEAEDGLEDPMIFRSRQGINRPEDAPDQPDNIPGQGDQAGPGEGQGFGDGTGDGGGAYGDGDGDGICDCECGDPGCDCTGECTLQGSENGPKGPKGGGK